MQSFKQKDSIIGNILGYTISNGSAFYDFITAKQYKNSTQALAAKKDKSHFESINSIQFPLLKMQSGIVINSKGYIIATIKDVNQVNNILVELMINDTCKTYSAEIFLKNELLNFVVLKVKSNSALALNSPYYSYSYMNTIDTEKNFVVNFNKRNTNNYSFIPHTVYGEEKKLLNYKYNRSVDDLIYGAPIFDLKGNLLGLFNNLSDKGVVEMIKFQLIYSKLNLNMLEEVPKLPIQEKETAQKNVFKNIVVLKIF